MAATREVRGEGPGPDGTRIWRVELVTETDSTNADLLHRAGQGEAPGLVRIADHQRQGRGRQGRAWFDQPASSLLMSVLLHIEPAVAPLVPLATGLAVVEAIGQGWGVSLNLTWPNDVIVVDQEGQPDRKLAGILAEALVVPEASAASGRSLAVVVGTGVNLDFGDAWRAEAPHDVLVRAIDLAELAGENTTLDRDAVADAILRRLDVTLGEIEDAPGPFLDRYRSTCATIGRFVDLDHPAGPVSGTVVDIDERGALVLETTSGQRSFDAGEVHTRR